MHLTRFLPTLLVLCLSLQHWGVKFPCWVL